MSRFRARPFLRLAMFATLAATLGLAACGRKGDLDPPPGASVTGQPQTQQSGLTSPIGAMPIGGGSSSSNDAGINADGRAQAPKGPNKPIPLDVLLN